MFKSQSPVPKKPFRSEAPLLTIHIHKTTVLALLVTIVVIVAALVLRGRQETPAVANAQELAFDRGADATTAPPDLGSSVTSSTSNASFTEDKPGADPQPPQPVEAQVRSMDVQPIQISPLEIRPVDVKPLEVPPILRTEARPVQASTASNAPPPTEVEGINTVDLSASSSPPSDVSDSTVVNRPNANRPNPGPANLNGAGATFPNPIYQKWFSEFHQQYPDIKINYQAIGSGGGIAQLQKGTVDFGASDGPMTDEQLSQTPFKVLHIPTVLGAVVPIYNIPGVNVELKFTGDVLADIYLGKIKKWNDPRLAKDNPGVKFPDADIVVVHRSDPSGTSYIWTDYLSKVSTDWANGPKRGSALNWPVGLGGKGNDGVAGIVKQTENSIGYVELIYALANMMSYGSVQNAAGQFVRASLESVTTAAGSVQNIPNDFRVSITNAPGRGAYPIASFTWLLVPQRFRDGVKGRDIVEFLRWMIDRGERSASDLGYAPLPANVARKVKQAIEQIQ
jgi:phosphate transport system substrate-binding protein